MPPQLWRRQHQCSVAATRNDDFGSLLESLVLEEPPSHSSPRQRVEFQTAHPLLPHVSESADTNQYLYLPRGATSCFTTQEPIPIPRQARDTYVIDPHHPSQCVPAFREPWETSISTTKEKAASAEPGGHSTNSPPHQNRSNSPPFFECLPGAKGSSSPPSLVDHGSGLPLYALRESWQLLIVEFKAGRVDIFYNSQEQGFHVGDFVIVETGYGKDLGQVVDNTITLAQLKAFQERQVGLERAGSVRGRKMIFPKMTYEKAKQEDIESLEVQRRDEVKVLKTCQERDRKRNLLLGPLRAEYQWDRRRLTFYCSGKVDMDYVKPAEGLSRLFKTEVFLMRLPIGEINDVSNNYLLGITHLPHHDSPTQTASRILRSESDETQHLIKRLTRLFKDKAEYQILLRCKGNAAQKLLNMFQRLLDVLFTPSGVNPAPPTSFQRNLVVATQRLAAATGLYPKSYELTDVTIPEIPELFGSMGGFADIYKGIFRGHEVCIKIVRLHQSAPLAHFMKVISREAILWKQLRHPNVLPFYGIYRYMGRIAFVAPWMKNGDIVEYLKEHPSSNRAVLTYDVIQGLEFLHMNGIIHGDLKGANVLVNELGTARLADFGLSSISDKEILAWTSFSSATSKGGTVRWQAPELFDAEGDEVPNTMPSDVYAFGMLVYEIFTGEVPFAHVKNKFAIIKRVSEGKRPVRPPESSPSWMEWRLREDIWFLMEACWNAQPEGRPSVQEIKRHLALGLLSNRQITPTLNDVQFREAMRKNSHEVDMSVETLECLLHE